MKETKKLVLSPLIFWLSIIGVGALASWAAAEAAGNSLRWGGGGFSKAHQADNLVDRLDLTRPTTESAEVWKDVKQLSMASLDDEPLSANSIRNLALFEAASGNVDQARKLFGISIAISRRDLPTHYWFIQEYGKLNDLEKLMAQVEIAMRTKQASWAQLVPALLSGLENQELVAPTARLLSTNPPWEYRFWSDIQKYPQSAENLAKLLISLEKSGHDVEKWLPDAVVRLLAKQQNFAAAFDVYRTFNDGQQQPTSEPIISNAYFARVPNSSIFDWSVVQSQNVEAVISPQDKALSVSIFAPFASDIASQVIRLPPGRYRFRVNLKQFSSEYSGALRVKLYCAEETSLGSAELIDFSITSKSGQANFDTKQYPCVFYRVNLVMGAVDVRVPTEFSITEISIVKN